MVNPASIRGQPEISSYREVSQAGTPREDYDYDAGTRLAGAKLVGGLQLLDKTQVQIEEGSVYGAVILMPQLARSLGWPQEITSLVVTATIYHILCMCLHASLLMYIDKEQKVLDGFAGQMYLCDFGANIDTCVGQDCLGPGGTQVTAPRLYNWAQWVTRNFVRDSLKAVFPHKAHEIDQVVDPGEYGVESYRCRLLCCIVFILSIVQEITLCWQMAKLLLYLPSKNESWVEFKNDDDREKSGPSKRKDWLDEVTVKVAGMGYGWKTFNAFFVFLPKLLLVCYTAKAGINFLMETAGVDDIIVNSVALGFLLGLDELITSALMSLEARTLLLMCESRPIEHGEDLEEIMNDEQILERFYHKQRLSGGGWMYTLRDLFFRKYVKIYIVIFVTAALVFDYYRAHCEDKDGRWVSKAMHSPKSGQFSVLNAFLPEVFPIDVSEEPFWTMPDGES